MVFIRVRVVNIHKSLMGREILGKVSKACEYISLVHSTDSIVQRPIVLCQGI